MQALEMVVESSKNRDAISKKKATFPETNIHPWK